MSEIHLKVTFKTTEKILFYVEGAVSKHETGNYICYFIEMLFYGLENRNRGLNNKP